MFKKMIFVFLITLSNYCIAAKSAEVSILLEAATQQNNAEAQWMLGEFYFAGTGVEQDLSQAKQWYEQAAEQQNPNALYSLGQMYSSGQGVNKDLHKAKELFQASCT